MSEAREARAFTCISVGISYWVGYCIVGVRKGLVWRGWRLEKTYQDNRPDSSRIRHSYSFYTENVKNDEARPEEDRVE